MEFQAVVLAAGHGQRMTDLTISIPKPLLPVANKPLLWYSLMLLERAGFEEAHVTVLKSQHAEIEIALQTHRPGNLRLIYLDVPDSEDWGTADTLRHHSACFKHDLIVLTCDLICDVALHLVADLHRTQNATLTTLLASAPAQLPAHTSVPGPKTKKKEERDLIGLETKSQRLVFQAADADFGDEVAFPTAMMHRFPRVQLSSHLLDAHLYILSKSALQYLTAHPSLMTVKGELVPRLVRRQHRRFPLNTSTCDQEEPVLPEQAMFLSCGGDDPELSVTRCYAYVMREGLCTRVNTLSAYCEANRQAARILDVFCKEKEEGQSYSLIHKAATLQEKTTVSKDSCVGEGASIKEKVTFKSSVLGSNSCVGVKCKVTGSVLMDQVVLEEGCHVTGCIICDRVRIKAGSELKDCIVTSRHTMEAPAKLSNEVIGDGGFDMEL